MLLVYPQRNGTSAPPAARLSESALNLNTPARQCSNKFDIALAYSHFGFAEDTPPRKKCKRACFFSLGLFVSLYYGICFGQDIRHAETLLGLHGIPSRAGADHP
ncbi:MAG: hypothetical protein SPH60_06395, partial [Alistipes senegalensis]|nr:hypothetical protein [Alistipes senegalensis]